MSSSARSKSDLLPTSRKNPYVADNGLHITDRTSQSVSIAWPGDKAEEESESLVNPEENNASIEGETTETRPEKETIIIRPRIPRNWYEVQMKKGEHSPNWETIYRGYGEKCGINGLPPDTTFVFRMKRKTEDIWGTEIVASTDPTPPSAEDLNRAVEMNSDYLVTRILGNTKSTHLKKILKAHDRNGMTPLMVACHNGNTEIAVKLIDAGCYVNEFSSGTNRTPLIYSCIMGMHSIALLLDQHGADWRIRDRCGCNAMDYAINGGYTALVKLAARKLGRRSLHDWDLCGWTPLMRAAIVSENLDTLKFLLRKGANPNGVDRSKSKNVLMAAILSKKPVFVRVLLEAGASPLFENCFGQNCFQIARGLEYREIKEILSSYLNALPSNPL